MNVLSLFDGLSAARIALEQENKTIDQYIVAETDKYAITISEKNYPDSIRFEDVCDLEDDLITDIDLLIGGSPCQGFSLQGLQKGLEDPRSRLVTEYIRLKNAIKPKYFLLENTKMPKECEAFITKALGVEPVKINSLKFLPQSRLRLYWTNIPIDPLPEEPALVVSDIITEGIPGTARKGPPRHVVYTEHFGCLTASYYKGIRADGRPLVATAEGEFDEVKDSIRMLTPEECEMLQGIPIGYTEGVSNTQRYKMLGNAFTVDVIAHIIKNI